MGVYVREADLDKDKDIMITLLNENRRKPTDEKRYHWLYTQNPYGKAIGWLVIDDKTDKPVGFTVVTPRLVRIKGNDIICWNCGDFSIDKKYRSLGVAVKLRKVAKEKVDAGVVPFLYAHPNDRMLVVHQRVGHPVMGSMQRYAKVINLNRKLREILKYRLVADMISWGVNPVLELLGKEQWYSRRKYEVEVRYNMEYTEEFDELFDMVSKKYAVCGVRNAKYLTWRYSMSPLYDIVTLILRKNTRICGYVIYYFEERDVVQVKDIFYLDDDAGKHLLGELILRLRRQNVCTISVGLLSSNPVINILKFFGFSRRAETSSVIVYANTSFAYRDIVQDENNWYMMVGDRDV